MVILRVAGTNLAVPVEREADFVELLTIAVDVGREFGVFKQYYSQDFKLSFFWNRKLAA